MKLDRRESAKAGMYAAIATGSLRSPSDMRMGPTDWLLRWAAGRIAGTLSLVRISTASLMSGIDNGMSTTSLVCHLSRSWVLPLYLACLENQRSKFANISRGLKRLLHVSSSLMRLTLLRLNATVRRVRWKRG